jgi:hypothetical protein
LVLVRAPEAPFKTLGLGPEGFAGEVDIDLRRLEVGVARTRHQRRGRASGRRSVCDRGVPEVVERPHAILDLGATESKPERRSETSDVEGRALRGRAEDALVVSYERCPPSVFEELGRNARAERDSPLTSFRLRRVHAGPHPSLDNAQVGTIGIGEVDLAPPEPEDLASPETGRHENQEDDAGLLAPETFLARGLGDDLQEGPLDSDLWWRQDPPAASRLPRTIDCGYGVGPNEGWSPLGGRDEQFVRIPTMVDTCAAQSCHPVA